MAYQTSSDFQSILDFATLNHQKKLRQLEIDSKIAIASFTAEQAKLAKINSTAVETTETLMGLRDKLKQLDPANPADKPVYDYVMEQMDTLLHS